jgi:hypothetical protein
MTTLSGVIKNKHILKIDGTVDVVGATTLEGRGEVLFTASSSMITVSGQDETLTNVNNVIAGEGGIFGAGFDHLALTNEVGGIIDASVAKGIFTLGTGAVLANAGKLEATNGGVMVLENQTVDDAVTGRISASGAGSIVELSNSHIAGGTLATSGGGVIECVGDDSLSGAASGAQALHNAGKVVVKHSNLQIQGKIVNKGVIKLAGSYSSQQNMAGGQADLDVAAGTEATLAGGGRIVLGSSARAVPDNSIFGGGGATLTNFNDVISGVGAVEALSNSGFAFLNGVKGVVDANLRGEQLILQTGETLMNSGRLLAKRGGQLLLEGQTVSNSTTGRIRASGAGSNIELDSGSIEGGTLSVGNGASMTFIGDDLLDDSDATNFNLGAATLEAGATLTLNGAIDASVSITFAVVGGEVATLSVAAGDTATLGGGGKVLLGDGSQNQILGHSGATLKNVDDQISGAGEILGFQGAAFDLINGKHGLIEANAASAALTIGASVGLTNDGVLEANDALLIVDDNVGGAGLAKIADGGTAEFNGLFDENAKFHGAGTLDILGDSKGDYTGTVSGFGAGDLIYLQGLIGPGGVSDYQAKFTENAAHTGGALSIFDTSSDATIYSLTLTGQYTAANFKLGAPGSNAGTTIAYQAG